MTMTDAELTAGIIAQNRASSEHYARVAERYGTARPDAGPDEDSYNMECPNPLCGYVGEMYPHPDRDDDPNWLELKCPDCPESVYLEMVD